MSIHPYFDGKREKPDAKYTDLPVIKPDALTHPKDYQAGAELTAAVNVALSLGMPLLLTGEPGCGKSELARRIAWELDFPIYGDEYTGQVLKYAVKSTTEARDLFYNYDTLGHFHAAQNTKSDSAVDPTQFIEYQALGLALLRAKGRKGDFPDGVLSKGVSYQLPEIAHRSVVLIDEIDKAPRDVPNDILNEIEHLEFTIPELGGARIGLDEKDASNKPVVIITSNSERDLPPAFLRRCVYFHLPFPPFEDNTESEVTVEKIVHARLGKRFEHWGTLQRQALDLCRFLRQEENGLYKPPSIAEILSWLSYLATHLKVSKTSEDPKTIGLTDFDEKLSLLAMKTTLLKTRDDQARAKSLFEAWKAQLD